ncbi:MAG: branched-chain amino acid ABC transporter permease [Firmicutes bacterium]|nr:branched-chain amino acid ABC transporter permease [Bacillota bacterium]
MDGLLAMIGMEQAGSLHGAMDVAAGAGSAGGIDWQLYATLFLNGLSQASHMFLVAVGLSLIFGVMRVLNLAHGAIHIAGVYVALTVLSWWDNWWVALLVAPLLVAAFGAGMEVALLRPMYGRHPTYVLILTFGVVLILHDLFKIGWGVDYKILPEPPALRGAVELFGIVYPVSYLFSIGAAVALGALLWMLLNHTRPGRIIRACAEDREMAASLGINVPLVYTAVFTLGTFLTAFGGVLMGTLMATSAPEALETMLYAFAVVVIGGLGSLGGAALGALLVGQLNSFGLLAVPEWNMAFMFLAMALVLVLRPRGLLGKGGA